MLDMLIIFSEYRCYFKNINNSVNNLIILLPGLNVCTGACANEIIPNR